MHSTPYVSLLLFYGFFLITSGIIAVSFIGRKAKTALISGGTAGSLVLVVAYLISGGLAAAAYAGLFLSLGLFCIFSWRATKTLFRLFEIIPTGHEELKGKGIAFLIIALMAVVSLIVSLLQLVFLNA